MKVLFWMFSGFDQHSTSEHLLTAIIKQLCNAGHSVHIIQRDTGGSLPSIPDVLAGHSVTTDVIPFVAADKNKFIDRYLAEIKYIKDCKRYIKPCFSAVFIQSNNVAGFALRVIRKKLPKAKVTFNVQDVFPYNAVFSGAIKGHGFVFRILSAEQRYGYKHVDHIVTISEDMKKTLVKDGVDSEKVKVIYNWSYQDELYENLDLTPVAHMFNKNQFNVVYAGNIGVMQNVDLLIETAILMKDENNVWFHIIGEGLYKEKLKERALKNGIDNITFWPVQPPEIAPLIYSAADVNIIPLVKNVYRTALPSKTATCLACQKPIIFAIGKQGDFARRIMNEAGCSVVDSNRPDSVAKEISKLMNNHTKTRSGEFFLHHCQMSVNSLDYVKIIVGDIR